MALVIWSLTSERRLLRSIACGPEKIFFYLAHLATQGYRSALPNTLLFSALSHIYGRNGVIPCKPFHATVPLRMALNAFTICGISRIKSAVYLVLAVIGLATMFLLPGGRGEQYSYQAEKENTADAEVVNLKPEITVIG